MELKVKKETREKPALQEPQELQEPPAQPALQEPPAQPALQVQPELQELQELQVQRAKMVNHCQL